MIGLCTRLSREIKRINFADITRTCRPTFAIGIESAHWRRLVKNIGWGNQNIGGQKVVKSDKCMGVSQLLEGHVPGAGLPHQSLRL